MSTKPSASERVELVLKQMTLDQKIALLPRKRDGPRQAGDEKEIDVALDARVPAAFDEQKAGSTTLRGNYNVWSVPPPQTHHFMEHLRFVEVESCGCLLLA